MTALCTILETLRLATMTPVCPDFQWPSTFSPADWETAAVAAQHHRITALLGYRMHNGIMPAGPDAWTAACVKQLHANRLRHVVARQTLEQIDEALTRRGIHAIFLKGPRLAEEAYTVPGMRSYDDLDVLTKPDDAPAAFEALRKLGYQPLSRMMPTRLVRRYHFHTQWWHPGTRQCVEVHERPADRQTLPRVKGLDYHRALANNPAAMLVYLAVHAFKHVWCRRWLTPPGVDSGLLMHPWSGLRWIWMLDLDGLRRARDISVQEIEATAAHWQVLSAWRTVTAWFSVGIPASGEPENVPSLLKPMMKQLRENNFPAEPWWLRPGRVTGFRPVRVMDLRGNDG